jgi:DNA-binding transcriptional regulator LsrR (DeoR family)
MDLNQLKTVPQVVAIAGGKEKTQAILGALRGGYINLLITDTVTAREILKEHTAR